jgi:hypothetical protein
MYLKYARMKFSRIKSRKSLIAVLVVCHDIAALFEMFYGMQ